VAVDDLSSITGLEDKHRRALARRKITTLRGLADADQGVIHRAMGSIRPRPSFKQIAQWQGEARNRLAEARRRRDQARGKPDDERSGQEARSKDGARSEEGAGGEDGARSDEGAGSEDGARSKDEASADTGEWHRVASFAVVFTRRRVGGTWEHRIEAERTEVEPEREPEVWPGWECSPICGWMLGQLGQANSAEPGGPDRANGGRARPAGEPADAAKPRKERPQLRIDSAAIIDAASRADLVTGGAVVANPPAELTAPTRVVFTVSGARRGTEVQAVARLRGHGEPGRNVADPVAVPPSGRAEFDLSQVTDDLLEMGLLAWAPDGTARPVSVSLPAMRISPGGE
jgi:hypothetical protein